MAIHRSQLAFCAAAALALSAVINIGAFQQRPLESSADVLACGRAALGEAQALANLSALSVTIERIPDQQHELGRQSTSEMLFSYPDTFMQTDTLRLDGTEIVRQKWLRQRPTHRFRALQ